MLAKWSFLAGADLEELHVKQRPLSELLPSSPAIYLWRRLPVVPYPALRDSKAFADWLDDAMQVPTGEVRDRRLSHFAIINHLTLQSQGLTDTKKRQLATLVSTPKRRRWLADYIRQLRCFSPPLYCGETGNLATRTKEHLSGETGFGQQVRDGRLPSWSNIELAYYSLDKVQPKNELHAKELATLLELITTAFAVAGYVSRRG